MLLLNNSVKEIGRVGAGLARKLKNLDIETIRDLLFYFPFRYDDFSETTAIKDLKPGTSANIVVTVELIQNKKSPRRRMNITEALVTDGEDTMKVIWFNQPFIGKDVQTGDRVSLSGKIDEDFSGPLMKSPNYEKILGGPAVEAKAVHTQGLIPNYHLTADLTQKQLRYIIKQAITVADQVEDWLPQEVQMNVGLLPLNIALKKIHFPQNAEDIGKAKKRLSFDELFLVQLQSLRIKKSLKTLAAPVINFQENETKEFVDGLPFKLTDDQRKSAWEIINDLGHNQPMSRLLEGDVGSGKTIVAGLAMFNAALNGRQSVLMVPTEILARQHYDSISMLFKNHGIRIGLVTRSEKKMNNGLGIIDNAGKQKNKKAIDPQFIIDNSDIIIGTHALIQEKLEYGNIALAIIDEQHRFGVEQRSKLLAQSRTGLNPHLLSMTATPIPRSLALALYGDLDISIIRQMPRGRKTIITKVVDEANRDKAYNFIRQEIKNGRQVFVICPLIDLSDKLGVKSVKDEFEKLDKKIFPDLNIGILHGRMKAKDKEQTMRDFLNNKIKILVSTSVVEVGIDVPNATVMMIEGADRFGLAQLHQFRGRVGRSDHQSYCFLFTDSQSAQTAKRLNAMVEFNDGFSLAQMDLKFRGPGEVYGTMQKGFPELKIASLFDYALMKAAKEQADLILSQDPELSEHQAAKIKLGEWEKTVHLE